MTDHMPSPLLEILRRLAPGTELREGIERIIQQRTGALVVLGSGAKVEALCTGGFSLRDTRYTAQRLAELAKMDGAIVLDSQSERILRANVHLIPDASIPTAETGTRHRTAERMAQQTDQPVVSVSEGRKMAILFTAGMRHELESPATVLPRANQMVQTLDRFRRRLDLTKELLTRQEVEGTVTYRAANSIIQRAEIIRRLGNDITDLTVALGDEGSLIEFQADDLLQGISGLADVVIADYARGRARTKSLEALSVLSISEVHTAEDVAAVYRFPDLDEPANPAGYRVLEGVPGVPAGVKDALVAKFKNLTRMLNAPVDKLATVEGVGPARARQLRAYFDQLQHEVGMVLPGRGD
ncbi:MAG: DNA integrity scanning diadenylate cyclase DisA [Acidimicrobiia bacterium]